MSECAQEPRGSDVTRGDVKQPLSFASPDEPGTSIPSVASTTNMEHLTKSPSMRQSKSHSTLHEKEGTALGTPTKALQVRPYPSSHVCASDQDRAFGKPVASLLLTC